MHPACFPGPHVVHFGLLRCLPRLPGRRRPLRVRHRSAQHHQQHIQTRPVVSRLRVLDRPLSLATSATAAAISSDGVVLDPVRSSVHLSCRASGDAIPRTAFQAGSTDVRHAGSSPAAGKLAGLHLASAVGSGRGTVGCGSQRSRGQGGNARERDDEAASADGRLGTGNDWRRSVCLPWVVDDGRCAWRIVAALGAADGTRSASRPAVIVWASTRVLVPPPKSSLTSLAANTPP